MEDLNLRREFLEAIGWHWVRDGGEYQPADVLKGSKTWPLKHLREPSCPKAPCIGDEYMHFRPGGNKTWASWDLYTIPVEADEGIALRELVKFCKSSEWKTARIEIRVADENLTINTVELCRPSNEVIATSRTLGSAICRAVISAVKGQ